MAFQDVSYNDRFITHAVNIADTLANLAYLIDVDAEDPLLVRQYARDADERLRALASLLGAVDCDGMVTFCR